MQSAAKRYFELNPSKLPREGMMATVGLAKLYSKNYLDALYIPYTKKMCSVEDSWVKVKKENEYTGEPVKVSVKKKAGKVKLVYYDRNKKKLKKAPTDPGVYYVRAKVSATKEYRKIISGYVKYKILKNTTEPFSLIQ